MKIKKYYQAAYQAAYEPVVDDVVLRPEYVHVPVEPVPDHKIVVEFAGQCLAYAASLMLSKTKTQTKLIGVRRPDPENQARSLATFKGLEVESKTLYMQITSLDQPMPLLLKLAENVQPVEKESEMEEWDNVLIPIRILAYLDADKDKAKASDLKGGYLYVFWKGTIWRELAINEIGYYQDIDIEYYRFLDKEERRKATPAIIKREVSGFPIPHFWTPYKIAGELQQGVNGLNVVFSPMQKPFSDIEALEADAALLAESSTPLDELSIYSDSKSFSVQEFTSDVNSAVVHSVTEEDMPWLSDKQAIVRSFDNSNTAIAYVDGKNEPEAFNIMLEDQFGEPYANRPYKLTAEEEVIESNTDGRGLISHEFPVTIKEVEIEFWPYDEEPEYSHSMVVEINEFAPIDDPIGLQQRLANLGVFSGNTDGNIDDLTKVALQQFQYIEGLEFSNSLDETTENHLNRKA